MVTSGTPSDSIRADQLVLSRGLARSRAQAQALIASGQVTLADGSVVDKASRLLSEGVTLHVVPPQFVSRAGAKLAAALDYFRLVVEGADCLDVGASTGGFTDCLLQRGAASVTAVDVGHGQLDPALARHPRLTSLEGINARDLAAVDLEPASFGIVVVDVSFISLTLVLGPTWARVAPGGHLVALIKPQFEVGRERASVAEGVIRDPAARASARERVLSAATLLQPSAKLLGWMDSPLAGPDGNVEFLAAWQK